MKLFSHIVSIVFHPLLMVTYGIILVLSFTYLAIYPTQIKWTIAGGTFLTTAVIPGLFVLLLIRNGAASDLALSDRRERAVPYLIILTSLLVCLYYFYKMKMPFWLLAILIGACVVLLAVLCINFFWKISAHTLGIGGLLGGVMAVSYIHRINPYVGFILLFLISGLVATSRIYLKRHTPSQVYAGFLLGFACIFGAVVMSYTYLFT
ncbi:phosphatase PAP2 family protein [Parabacteroides sp. 52]|uniref:phosphatase PAP2 family protein n=1 Tax=unclassified Parabacteroides TaxID=2649774 RepID=UPI0013D323F1|nr:MULTISPECIES: phosphatase PAP2 family protein [unclassified Parabacteroides]MDH6534770.1 membrane-associated phospholipid phosphatase [Parabacteroides sp. PM5-20]NDV55775.1 phosphatase PAP2 family protein [Parabacteroides sp. 52]